MEKKLQQIGVVLFLIVAIISIVAMGILLIRGH
jgi:hypothetical protein